MSFLEGSRSPPFGVGFSYIDILEARAFCPSLKAIEKALVSSDLGMTPNNDGEVIRLTIPPLTSDRRKEMSKIVAKQTEEGKVALRNIRRDAIKAYEKLEKEKKLSEDNVKDFSSDLQKVTDEYIKKIESIYKQKEKNFPYPETIPESGGTMLSLTSLRRSMPKTEENIVIRFSKLARKPSQNGSTGEGHLWFQTANDTVPLRYLAAVADLDEAAQYYWGLAILVFLYPGLDTAVTTGGDITGFAQHLTYWFYEYCGVGHSIVKEDVKFSAYPRLRAWERGT
ncbi:hypothetical protein GIB67_029046 [Kingdonia uniflora]|uniref:Ribosome-recycling factor, chloroplastic n=1 Tax=Kingdonia uniflora TaxID=39325 RepID=A0A7J7N6L1_9MAGN|nr:hypothetical protein GIB67_029046 [Kingdonia uniflora]